MCVCVSVCVWSTAVGVVHCSLADLVSDDELVLGVLRYLQREAYAGKARQRHKPLPCERLCRAWQRSQLNCILITGESTLGSVRIQQPQSILQKGV